MIRKLNGPREIDLGEGTGGGAVKSDQFAQQCLDRRGYVVIGSAERQAVGDIIAIDDQPGTAVDGKGVVIAITNRSDMVEQLRTFGWDDRVREINAPFFYRVVAE